MTPRTKACEYIVLFLIQSEALRNRRCYVQWNLRFEQNIDISAILGLL